MVGSGLRLQSSVAELKPLTTEGEHRADGHPGISDRLGFRMLALILARRLRDTMLRAASLGETQLLSDCVHRTDLLARAETELRSNVNLKQLLANLAAQWALPA